MLPRLRPLPAIRVLPSLFNMIFRNFIIETTLSTWVGHMLSNGKKWQLFFKILSTGVILKADFDCIYGYPLSGTASTESKEEFANSKSWRTYPVTELSSEFGNFKINRLTMFFVKTRLCHLAPDLVKEVPGRIMAVMASRSFLTHLYASDDTIVPVLGIQPPERRLELKLEYLNTR